MTPVARLVVAGVVLASLAGVGPARLSGQSSAVVSVRITLDGGAAPVPRHVLLVSDNPASRVPWRVVIGQDGHGRVTLPAANYTIESEEPLVFGGRALEWRQTFDVVAGSDVTLEFTPDNAMIVPLPEASATAEDGTPLLDQWAVLARRQDGVVGLWTPTTMAAGFVVSNTGLVATNTRAVGKATSVELQLRPDLKIAARVLAVDADQDVAILWADADALGARTPIATGCRDASQPSLSRSQPLVTLAARPGSPPFPTRGTVRHVEPTLALADFDAGLDITGGPVFVAGDVLAGLTSVWGDDGEDFRLVRVDALCATIARAEAAMQDAPPPSATPLPLEAVARAPERALAAAATRRAGSLNPYQIASSDFDIAFITPVAAHAAAQGLADFGNWSRYVAMAHPVLFVRVTPKQAERFWTKVARGAALTQGIALPAFKHFKPGFDRLQVTCGGAEVVPIHPFVIERQVSATAAVREGLYAFEPRSIGPHCGTVTLSVYSEKDPARRDAVDVDARVLDQLGKDVVEYEALVEQPRSRGVAGRDQAALVSGYRSRAST